MIPTKMRIRPTAKVPLPSQSILAGVRIPRSSSFTYAKAVPRTPKGTEIKKTRCHSTGASSPPRTSPMNEPAMAATLLMPRPQTALVSREGVGDDGRGVGEEHGPADPLAHPHDDQPDRPFGPTEPGDGQKDREDGEHGKAEVEDLHPAEHVADPAQGDDEHGQHHHEAHQHPQHVAGVAGRERVEVDPPEDVGQ